MNNMIEELKYSIEGLAEQMYDYHLTGERITPEFIISVLDNFKLETDNEEVEKLDNFVDKIQRKLKTI